MRTSVGSYHLTGVLGEGGMGTVYRANHALLGRPAAIKLLLPELSRNQDIVNRFFNEARAATAIRHPGIVEIYDFGYVEDGSAYIAMELLEGESLATRLAARRMLGPADAVWVVRQIAGALGAAHARGIVHRDLKPDNVFLVRDPEVMTGERIKLLDFGIAKLAGEPGQAQKTRTGALMGTPTYMAPEQCRGVSIDLRADLYSLGCMLFEMVCGRIPFVGEGVGDILAAHIHVPPPAPRSLVPDLPVEVEALILHLLAKDPAQRPQSAEQVVAAIDALLHVVGTPGVAMSSQPTIARVHGMGSRPPSSAPSQPPTTLTSTVGAYAAPGTMPPSSGRRGLWIALAGLVVGGAAIAIVVVASGGSKATSDGATQTAAASPALVQEPPPAPKTEPATPTKVEPTKVEAAPPKVEVPKPVTLAIDTQPRGAKVMDGDKELGVTPLKLDRPPTAGSLHLVVKLDGYQDLEMDVPGDASVDRLTPLVKVETKKVTRPTTKKTTTKKTGSEDRNAGVNPFD